MGEIIKFRKPSLVALDILSLATLVRPCTSQKKAEGKTLCKSGFHRWKVVTARKFDVKQGKLVTLRRCERCGKEKTELR